MKRTMQHITRFQTFPLVAGSWITNASGKEKDKETGYSYTLTALSTSFGARYYSLELSVWLLVDPLASTPIAIGASMSAYMYTVGNPVMLVDPDGDSTIYANSAGKILFKSHDNMDNAVVIISNDKIDEFNSYLNKMKDNGDEDNLSHNAYLRVMGDIYDIVEIKKWYHKVLDGGTPNNPSLINAICIYNRYKSQDIIINNTSFK